MEFSWDIIWYYIQLWIIIIVSISLHEYAHAYSSYKLGDPTPKIQWRLTPNPLKHIDPIGFIMIFFIHFWWWRPVQIDPSYYKHPYRDELITALAWPVMNIFLWVIWILIMMIYGKIFWLGLGDILSWNDLVENFWFIFSSLNFGLAAFNLIPIVPLDWYRLVKIISHKAGEFMEKYMTYISLAFLLLVVFWPFSELLSDYITSVSSSLFRIFAFPLSQIFY